jgi:hypothetical protein
MHLDEDKHSSLFWYSAVDRKKFCNIDTSGVIVIKLFSSLTLERNKLERLSLSKPYQPSLILGSKARFYPIRAPEMYFPLGRLLALPSVLDQIETAWKG